MIFNNPSDICEFYINEVIKQGDTVVDATVGNGNDTLKLSNAVGENGLVYGFDIQEQAIEAAKKQNYKYSNVIFLNHSHADMDKYIIGEVSAVIFNLGYLPGGDHNISTKYETTVSALEKAMKLLAPGGTVITVIYRGGDSGFEECDGVVEYIRGIDYKRFNVLLFDYISRPKNPPMVCVIQKK
ncbi:MAG: methyltransferase domain-containing protein [Clostridia bacterium]|nr:methyltransferase domain-containing protein [Clostridia bacterium]